MVNYWLGVDAVIHNDIMSYFKDPDNYSGDTPVEHIQMFGAGTIDLLTVLRMFKPYNSKHLYTVYVSDPDVFAMLLSAYPGTDILGAWQMDGVRIDDLSADTLNYMPDIFVEDDMDTGAGHYVPAVEITDINISAGQSPRDFS